MKAGWQVKPLGEVVRLNYGKAISKDVRRPEGTVPVYGANGVMDYCETVLSHGPSLIIGRKGSAGALNLAQGPFWASDVTYYTEHNPNEVDFAFLHYALTQANLPALSKGVKPGINRNEVYELPIPLPPLDEQKRIVAVLDEAFEGLDRARANAEANLADARELFESFVRFEFTVRGASWLKVRLPDISQNLDSRRIPITKADRKAGDTPYYGASGVVDYVDGHLFDEDLLLVSEDGANLLSRTYPIAFSVSGKSWVNNHAHVLKFESEEDRRFVEVYLNSISLEPFVSGMAQPKLNQKALNAIPIPFPSSEARESLTAKAFEIQACIEQLGAHYRQVLSDLAFLRQSLLQKAFSGELT